MGLIKSIKKFLGIDDESRVSSTASAQSISFDSIIKGVVKHGDKVPIPNGLSASDCIVCVNKKGVTVNIDSDGTVTFYRYTYVNEMLLLKEQKDMSARFYFIS